ncbi:hypothetical protein DICSQDRAFT_172300 [Dichomitus squalens LYAD-421 SS1]|uniref:Uncharacterized protein n=1 Tax=Dichomitus squalens (strain LYAD-421) TaxID=732165 RepID=R7STU4_DICSQ|nr:uncharacterized protein DICSQDRAFT_172300 [Dichomitus squalens LYAD-421 SS1]EJF59150.1 hypothetical protein DICSQDRAFT_172300 [Dichomitus squalens LYAD-421 SS1]
MIGAPYTNTTGPFGLRVHAPLSGGNLTDATTGEVVATMLPTADDGFIIGSATLFSHWVLPYVWKTDGKLASMTPEPLEEVTAADFRGPGVKHISGQRRREYDRPQLLLCKGFLCRHVETDSSAYSWMNSNFFIMKIVGTAEPLVHNITIYGVAN